MDLFARGVPYAGESPWAESILDLAECYLLQGRALPADYVLLVRGILQRRQAAVLDLLPEARGAPVAAPQGRAA